MSSVGQAVTEVGAAFSLRLPYLLLASLLNSLTSVTHWPGLFNISWPFKSTPAPAHRAPIVCSPNISVTELLTQPLPLPSLAVTTATTSVFPSAPLRVTPTPTPFPSDVSSQNISGRLICFFSIFPFVGPPFPVEQKPWQLVCLPVLAPPAPSCPLLWLAGWRESWFYLFFCLFGKRAVAALGLAAVLRLEPRAGRRAGLPGM